MGFSVTTPLSARAQTLRCLDRLPKLSPLMTHLLVQLSRRNCDVQELTEIVEKDPVLSAQILRLANSAFMNPSGRRINDVKRAVTQLGHQLVRCTAVSFALRQMELDGGNLELRPQLQELWRQGMLVASIACVLARQTRAASADEALVAGLMHNIGLLYIAVSSPRHEGAGGKDSWADVVHEWHPRIARAILKHWGFPPTIIAAVGNQNDLERETRGGEELTDILIAATALVPCVFYRERLSDTGADH